MTVLQISMIAVCISLSSVVVVNGGAIMSHEGGSTA